MWIILALDRLSQRRTLSVYYSGRAAAVDETEARAATLRLPPHISPEGPGAGARFVLQASGSNLHVSVVSRCHE